MKTKLILIFKIISAASFIYIGALIFLLMKNDVFKVNDTIITFSIIDFLLTIFMFSFLILGYRYKILKVFDYLTFYGLKLKKNLIKQEKTGLQISEIIKQKKLKKEYFFSQ